MKRKTTPPFCSFIFLLTIQVYFTMMPQMTSEEEGPQLNSQPLEHLQVKHMSKQPYYVGSENHDQVANYLKMNYKIRD
jgi:hypothetical protein